MEEHFTLMTGVPLRVGDTTLIVLNIDTSVPAPSLRLFLGSPSQRNTWSAVIGDHFVWPGTGDIAIDGISTHPTNGALCAEFTAVPPNEAGSASPGV